MGRVAAMRQYKSFRHRLAAIHRAGGQRNLTHKQTVDFDLSASDRPKQGETQRFRPAIDFKVGEAREHFSTANEG